MEACSEWPILLALAREVGHACIEHDLDSTKLLAELGRHREAWYLPD